MIHSEAVQRMSGPESTKPRVKTVFVLVLLLMLSFTAAMGQNADEQGNTPPSTPNNNARTQKQTDEQTKLVSLPGNLLQDQKDFWTTPFHMSEPQWQWTVPLAFVGAGLLASDTAIEKHVPASSTTASHAVTASNAGLAALVGVGGGMFLLGHWNQNDQLRETGLLSGEAAIDAAIDSEIFKYAFGRERPFTADNKGRFFQGGTSFPSQHATASWAIASVIAHEYPGPLTELLAYGVAGGVSAARLVGHQHFAADVIIGSALGWYTGRQVFRKHSRYSQDEIAKWGTFSKGEDVDSSAEPANMGSPYVPLDSWIYPALERLIALGYISSADLGMRPWTRMECARLMTEVSQHTEYTDTPEEVGRIYSALTEELSEETARANGDSNFGVKVDSVYTRFAEVTGRPLRDGLHFGQTIINDFGRPYGQGMNNVTGFSSHAVAGALSFYVRAEYQHAAALPGISPAASAAIQVRDGLPTAPPTTPTPQVNQIDLLEGYVGMQLNNWQFTIGKQSLWWGADHSGPMLFSDNAEPILMLQLNRVKPFRLPSVFATIGDIRVDYLIGRLNDYHWLFSQNTGYTGSWTSPLSDPPFIVGEKVTLKPTQNLELGISATALFAGSGVPATSHKLLQAMFSQGNGLPGTSGDPGDRRGGFDLSYRLPTMRDWATFYVDAFTDDEPNPWLAWNKSAVTSGLYFARLPRLPKLDLRLEGVYTDPPGGSATVQHGFFYNNDRYRSGYTNAGNLIGSWIGRQGQGAEAWTNYWFTPKSNLQFNFRHQKVSSQFIPEGGTLSDFGVSGNYYARPELNLKASVQYERWLFPVIQPGISHDVTAMLQISFEPHKSLWKSSSSRSATQP